MAFGLVCIGSNRGFVPEMLGSGRGLVVPPRDVDALAALLLDIADNPAKYEAMRLQASAWARQYSLEGLRTAIKRGKFLDFICYGSLYTIFVAGPIERFENLKPQFEAVASRFRTDDLAYAFMRIVFGLFKKLVLADWIGFFIHPVFQNNSTYPLGIKILAILGYSLQIYFDFAGYSDIAIGSSRLFGLRIMENFDNPYLSTSITQFWRKWHISLSDWIRNYLFFPLSQNRSNKIWLTICVPIIAMAICGLWHGSAWHYVIWGIWHGSGIAIYQQWSTPSLGSFATLNAISGLPTFI